MTTYTVTMTSGYEWYMFGDFSRASSSLTACFHDPECDDNWQGSPYQVADVWIPEDAAELLWDHWSEWADGDDAVASVEA
tara:strand:- start:226 stop:465 length:240 start_codon:yes stop_codon:yes gene_type:complete